MKKELIDSLETCLKVLEQGGTVEECLNRFPAYAEALRPLLEQSIEARGLGLSPIPGTAVTVGRVRILNSAAKLRQNKSPLVLNLRAWRFAAIPLLVLALFFITGNGLLIASAKSLPGDILYPLKRSMEGISLLLAPNSKVKAEIQKEISSRRIDETESLLSEKRVETVDFGGQVSKQLSDGWTIAGIHVQVTWETQMEGALALGARVKVLGQTQLDGSVLAAEVKVESGKHEHEDNRSGSSGAGEGTPQPEITTDEPSEDDGGDNDGSPKPTNTEDHSLDSRDDDGHDSTSTEEPPHKNHVDENDD